MSRIFLFMVIAIGILALGLISRIFGFGVVAIGLLLVSLLLIVIALVYDYREYLRERKHFEQTFGPYIGQAFRVIRQNEEEGSVLENNLALHDIYVERGIVHYDCKVGDMIKIVPFPKFRPCKTIDYPFEKINQG